MKTKNSVHKINNFVTHKNSVGEHNINIEVAIFCQSGTSQTELESLGDR